MERGATDNVLHVPLSPVRRNQLIPEEWTPRRLMDYVRNSQPANRA